VDNGGYNFTDLSASLRHFFRFFGERYPGGPYTTEQDTYPKVS
jgi:hypothetical protein